MAWSNDDWHDLETGVTLFNEGRFWHAHEAWEEVWRRHRDAPEGSFCKGLIQLAAAHHQRTRGRFNGMAIHLERSRNRLLPFAPTFAGVEVSELLRGIDALRLLNPTAPPPSPAASPIMRFRRPCPPESPSPGP